MVTATWLHAHRAGGAGTALPFTWRRQLPPGPETAPGLSSVAPAWLARWALEVRARGLRAERDLVRVGSHGLEEELRDGCSGVVRLQG